MLIMATGSEVSLALAAAETLDKDGIKVAEISIDSGMAMKKLEELKEFTSKC